MGSVKLYLGLRSQPEIARRITFKEYYRVVTWAKKMGLTNLDIQGYPFFTTLEEFGF